MIKKKLPSPITKATFEKEIGKWLKFIAVGESGCIIFTPRMDRHRRIDQLLNSPQLLKRYLGTASKYKFLSLDFDLFPVEDVEDLSDYITSQLNVSDLGRRFPKFPYWLSYLKSKKIGLILMVLNAERLFQKTHHPIFSFLASIVEKNPFVQLLLFFEKDLTHPDNFKIISKSVLFQNILYYPLYKDKDIRQFIFYLGCKWNLKIPNKITSSVIRECGSHFLLVKEAIRYYRNHPQAAPKRIFDHGKMKLRLEWIYESFSSAERKVLKKISFEKTSFTNKEKISLSYFKKIGVVNEKREITMPLLQKYVQERQDKGTQLVLKDKEVLLNNVPVKIFFSCQEYRVLKGLLENRGKLVTRNKVACYIWPTNTDENYSDWAIDQLIRRLRKKLGRLFISPKVLRTKRGQGHLLVLD